MTRNATFGLLRHGDTGESGFRGRLNDALLPGGWRAMDDAIHETGPWQAVASSPLSRCAAFAESFACAHKLPLLFDPRLRELDFGAWDGATPAELMQDEAEAQTLAAFWRDPWQYPPTNGETAAALETRVLAALGGLADAFPRKLILVVTHGGVIRTILRRARRLPHEALLSIDVPHASLNCVTFMPPAELREIPCPIFAHC